jgi:SAM-dependent methyltransferase
MTSTNDEPGARDGSGTWHYGLVTRWWAEVNRPETAELAYLRAAIRRYGEPALDLGCGAGRLLLPLLAEGFDVDGTDISADMIGRVREGASAAGVEVAGRLALQPFDGLDRSRRYGTVFSIGSFAIGGSAERDAAALRRIHDHLLPGGAVLLSYEVASDADHARMADPATPYPRPWPQTGPRAVLADGDELELLTRAAAYDAATRTHRLEIRARLWREGTLVREEAGSLRNTYYRPEDVARMLRESGFVDIDVQGPYTGRPPEPADDTVVVVARRVS